MNFPSTVFVEALPNHFVVEASTLRLPPGQFPDQFTTKPKLGNGQPFIRETLDESGARYRQGNGVLTVKIFND